MAIDLKSIARTTRASAPPRIVVHGVQGVGKTTFAASSFKPIFLPFEDGLTGLAADAFPLLTTFESAIEALDALANDQHDFGTAVLDSLDWLEPLIWNRVARDAGKDSIEDISYGKGYLEATNYWRTILDKLNALRAKGMATILIAHTEVKRFDAPDMDAFDRYVLKLHKGASSLVVEWADIVGLAQTETAIKKEAQGFKDRVRGIATGRRVLRVNESPAYVAKNRFGLPDPLPLDWAALVQAISTVPGAVAEAA
ncbi:MAG: ATP-binding protein [Dokdonella sp.]